MPKIVTGDRDSESSSKISLIIVLDRLRSAHNVGNIFRLADAVNLEAVYTCGYTASPPHPKLAKTAMGTDEFVKCKHFEQASLALEELKQEDYTIYAVETAEQAKDIYETQFAPKSVLVFGNEALGIQDETLELCDQFIRLSAHGKKNSINVSNCAAVCLFTASTQMRT